MREIKFRAWNIKEKAYWNYITGFVFENSNQGVYKVSFLSSAGDEETLDGNDFIFEQFTGLFDNNDREIYEGDILKEFGNDEFIIVDIPTIYYFQENSIDSLDTSKCNIIGNIHENPELLK